jgi:L-threonylcarbamoyladenylate synthase
VIENRENNFICVEDNFDEALIKAKQIYLEGGIFIYPTDTIYGLGANPFNDAAVNKINLLKGRESDKNYIYLIDSVDTLLSYVEIHSEKHFDFLNTVWPNPVSIVLKLNKKTSDVLKQETGAFRIPNHRFCLNLASKLKMPIISTSVNKAGTEPLNHPEIFKQDFSTDVDGIFYSKKMYFDKASTLIDLTGSELKLLREGKIRFDELAEKFR